MIRKEIMDEVKWSSYPELPKGGQSVHRIIPGIKLSCEVLGFEISICNYRSQFRNKELAMTLFELFLLETNQN